MADNQNDAKEGMDFTPRNGIVVYLSLEVGMQCFLCLRYNTWGCVDF